MLTKISTRAWGLSAIALTIGGAALTLAGSGTHGHLGAVAFSIGLGCFAAAGLFVIVSLITKFFELRLFRKVSRALIDLLRQTEYQARIALASELPAMYQYAVQTLGSGVVSLDRMQAWVKKNPKIFSVITSSEKRQIVGGYSLIPLSRTAMALLESNILDAHGVIPSHIVRNPRRAACFYVGAVMGDTRFPRAIALQGIETQLRLVASNQRIYTRPVTADGLRICSKRGFQPLRNPGLSNLYYLDFP